MQKEGLCLQLLNRSFIKSLIHGIWLLKNHTSELAGSAIAESRRAVAKRCGSERAWVWLLDVQSRVAYSKDFCKWMLARHSTRMRKMPADQTFKTLEVHIFL